MSDEKVPRGAVKIGDHLYPDNYPAGRGRDLDIAWEILDTLAPNALSLEMRSYLAGAITGVISAVRRGER